MNSQRPVKRPMAANTAPSEPSKRCRKPAVVDIGSVSIPIYSPEEHPRITFHFPRDSCPRVEHSVIICFRGGGYATCLGSGDGAAAWFASQGMVGVEVEYSTSAVRAVQDWEVAKKQFYPDNAIRDAECACSLVRDVASNGERRASLGISCGLSSEKIGVIGFSAGGHLASLVATPIRTNPSDPPPWAPNRVILCYPVISFVGEGSCEGAMSGSIENFLGPQIWTLPGQGYQSRAECSTELRVAQTAAMAPTFVWHTVNDDIVPVEHSVMFWQACRKAGVPVELHVYEDGEHGQGLALGNPRVKEWTTQVLAWLGEWALPVQCYASVAQGSADRSPEISLRGDSMNAEEVY